VNVGAGLELNEAIQRYTPGHGGAVNGLYMPLALVEQFLPEAFSLLIERHGRLCGGSTHRYLLLRGTPLRDVEMNYSVNEV
jgi:hypothetical protein